MACLNQTATIAAVPRAAFNGKKNQQQPRRITSTRCMAVSVERSSTKSTDTPTFEMRKLGDSDLVISEVTLGTMTFGNQNTEAEAHEQLSYAFDMGINILDTAEVYPVPMNVDTQGSTDRYISTWLKSQPRDKVVVATKVAGFSPNLTYLRDSKAPTRVDGSNIEESVNKSLKRLGVDHIDLLQIHWPDRYVPLFGEPDYDISMERDSVEFVEQLRGFQKVIEQGKVRYIGVSNETSYGVMKFVEAAERHGLPKIVSIQNCYHLIRRLPFEMNLAEVCSPRHANVGLLAYSPMAGGVLSGKYLHPDSPAAQKGRLHLFKGFMDRYKTSRAQEAVAEYVKVAEKHGLSPAQLALAFVRDRWFVTSSIIGATSLEQLKENLATYALPRPLSPEVMADVKAVFNEFKDPSMM